MAILSTRRIWGLAFVAVVVLVGVLIASSAASALRQSIALSLESGILAPRFLLMLVPFAAWSYGLRVVRWHTLVRRLVPGLPLRVSSYSQVVGFAFSATPGRVAELYKLKLIERSTSVSVAQSLPAAIVERATDIVAFGVLVVIGGLFNWTGAGVDGTVGRWIVFAAALAIAVMVYQIARRIGWRRTGERLAPRWQRYAASWSGRFPALGRLSSTVRQLRAGGSRVTNPYTLAIALACVVIGRFGDGVILWQIAQAVGYPVSFSLALLMIGSAGLIGGITLSPGGMGAAEATLVGLIVAHGAPVGAAMVTAFGARALIFWLWVAVGLLVFVASHGGKFVGGVRLGPPKKVLAHTEERM